MAWQLGTDPLNQTPYNSEFAELYTSFTEYPNAVWKLGDDIPYKVQFAELYTKFDEVPNAIWILDSECETPYKRTFAELYNKFNEVPKEIWVITDEEDSPWKFAFPELYRPKRWKKVKSKRFKVVLPKDYNTTITIRKDVR